MRKRDFEQRLGELVDEALDNELRPEWVKDALLNEATSDLKQRLEEIRAQEKRAIEACFASRPKPESTP